MLPPVTNMSHFRDKIHRFATAPSRTPYVIGETGASWSMGQVGPRAIAQN